ncbi:MAG TPA: rhomboid family intramembrane serine protease [Longilinea sp.]|nr:rhomboid family intramembrane serine protease [Longilinea sp.]
MIPLGDASRRPIHFPFMTLAIISVNAFVFILELIGGDDFINYWSLTPANIMTTHGILTIFTSMFMHAGWEHILGNMLFFWVFAPEIEDVMGSLPFLIFYLLGGLAATFAQVIVDPTSTIPNLGASGAIAAVMGAFLITYPRDKIRTVVLIGWFARITFLPAILMVGLWFLTQLFSEVGALAQVTGDDGGVAYMAHIGGFIFGMLACRLFETRRRRRLEGPEQYNAY